MLIINININTNINISTLTLKCLCARPMHCLSIHVAWPATSLAQLLQSPPHQPSLFICRCSTSRAALRPGSCAPSRHGSNGMERRADACAFPGPCASPALTCAVPLLGAQWKSCRCLCASPALHAGSAPLSGTRAWGSRAGFRASLLPSSVHPCIEMAWHLSRVQPALALETIGWPYVDLQPIASDGRWRTRAAAQSWTSLPAWPWAGACGRPAHGYSRQPPGHHGPATLQRHKQPQGCPLCSMTGSGPASLLR